MRNTKQDGILQKYTGTGSRHGNVNGNEAKNGMLNLTDNESVLLLQLIKFLFHLKSQICLSMDNNKRVGVDIEKKPKFTTLKI